MTNGATREQVLSSNPLTEHLRTQGVALRGSGTQRTSNRCPGHQHKKDHWCVTVDVVKQIWHCNDCDTGGSIVDWLAIEKGSDPRHVFKELAARESNDEAPMPPEKPQIVATYDYTDERGNLLYQVVRMVPKSFRQRQPDDKGGWKWTMDGATRVLYRLPEVLRAQTVVCCEGEKDADNLAKLGFCSTTSVAGAKSWLPSYAEHLKGKDLVIIPDNDADGKAYAEAVIASVADLAASAKVVSMPGPHKDASDYIATFPDPAAAKKALDDLFERAPHFIKPLPVLSMAEMEAKYMKMVQQAASVTFDLARYIPSLGRYIRHIVPGELVTIMASTGVGKTALLQGLAMATHPMPTLFFELELPAELMFERFVQMSIECSGQTVEEEYRSLNKPIWQHYQRLPHIMVCPESGLSTAAIEKIICKSELRFGTRPKVVLVDYIGLIKHERARSRYEAVSYAAEELKVIAKRTETICIMATQVARPGDKKEGIEVGLHDAKDSGSVENSSGLVIGAWRPSANELVLKILKNTKGQAGAEIRCNFNGQLMKITEQSPVSQADRYTG